MTDCGWSSLSGVHLEICCDSISSVQRWSFVEFGQGLVVICRLEGADSFENLRVASETSEHKTRMSERGTFVNWIDEYNSGYYYPGDEIPSPWGSNTMIAQWKLKLPEKPEKCSVAA